MSTRQPVAAVLPHRDSRSPSMDHSRPRLGPPDSADDGNTTSNNDYATASTSQQQQRTKQQTSSRMMKTTRRGRPYAKDTHDLFATLIVSLQLTTHRTMFKSYPNSFSTDEAAENLSALKFSQSNRAPDPREPSRVVTTTTTTTFSMNRDMAKGICQHFMDARLIENAADASHTNFKEKGIYQLTPKGLHILERFITKNGINGEHLLAVFSSQPICMKLLHLERRAHDDELLINRPIVEAIFRRFAGRQPNYLPGSIVDGANRDSGPHTFDRTMGVGMSDIVDKHPKGPTKGPVTIKHTFAAVAALDWLCDFSTICGRDEAAEVGAHFQRLGLIELARESSKKDTEEDAAVNVTGADGIGQSSHGEFKCHYKVIYGVTDRGRSVARWPAYTSPAEKTSAAGGQTGGTARAGPSAAEVPQQRSQVPEADDVESIDSGHHGGRTHQDGSRDGNGSRTSSSQEFVGGIPDTRGQGHHAVESGSLGSTPAEMEGSISAAERLRNDYLRRESSSASGTYQDAEGGLVYGHHGRDSNSNRLKQILDEAALRSLFRDFLKQNFCEENLSFWLDVQDFKRRFHTTSSAVAVRPGAASGAGSSAGGDKTSGGKRGLFGRSGGSDRSKEQQGQGYTAMEKHQQDLIAMAFVIYNTYLAPASPYELNIEHNLRTELVSYMSKVIYDAKTSSGGYGTTTVRAQDLHPGSHQQSQHQQYQQQQQQQQQVQQAPQSGGNQRGLVDSWSAASDTASSHPGVVPFAMSSPSSVLSPSTSASVDERKITVSATLPRAPLHASQLQTIVRLYERIQDHTFRLMATDSVPRFIKDARFLNLVRSVEEYTEALESGRLDPNDASGPVISRAVVDAMDLGGLGGTYSVGGGGRVPMAL